MMFHNALLASMGLTMAVLTSAATPGHHHRQSSSRRGACIAVGYSADLVAVDENPLINIRTLEKPEWAMVRGRIVK
jgi:imidazolonepropionase-like amidohydrolase